MQEDFSCVIDDVQERDLQALRAYCKDLYTILGDSEDRHFDGVMT